MVRRIARVEVTVVNSEQEALLLECNLIKAHRPRYNIMLRDDKSFPYILCSAGHEFPRLVFYRGPRQKNSRQFGPFASAHAVKEVLQHLQKVFKIRNCRDSFFANRSRPCLQHQIGRCSAPCVGLIGREEYAHDLEGAIGVLEGRNAEVIGELQRRMEAAAQQLKFEDAARLRDQLRELQEIRSQQIANAQRRADTDVIAIVGEPGQYAICVLPVREGQNLGIRQPFPGQCPERAGRHAGGFSAALLQPRAGTAGDSDQHRAAGSRAGSASAGARRWPLIGAARAAARPQAPVAGAGARQRPQRAAHARAARRAGTRGHAAAGAGTGSARPPERVECFDVSHTAGEGTVASCVVFTTEGRASASTGATTSRV
jgi:excinuclease ABC subunit C